MSPLQGVWVASVMGAMLFFVAGFLSARRRRAVAGLAVGEVPAEVVARAGVRTTDQLVAAGAMPRAEAEQLRRRALAAEQLTAQLQRRLVGAELAAAADARQELAMEVEALRGRAADYDRVAEENAQLRVQATECDELRRRIGELERQSEVTQVDGRPLARATESELAPLIALPVRHSSQHGTEHALQRVLLDVAAAPTVRSVALADDLGLPIVGMGADTSALAAFAGYIDDIARKASGFLPLLGVSRLVVEDAHGATVTACPFAADDAAIVLVTLTSGPGPSHEAMEAILHRVAQSL